MSASIVNAPSCSGGAPTVAALVAVALAFAGCGGSSTQSNLDGSGGASGGCGRNQWQRGSGRCGRIRRHCRYVGCGGQRRRASRCLGRLANWHPVVETGLPNAPPSLCRETMPTRKGRPSTSPSSASRPASRRGVRCGCCTEAREVLVSTTFNCSRASSTKSTRTSTSTLWITAESAAPDA